MVSKTIGALRLGSSNLPLGVVIAFSSLQGIELWPAPSRKENLGYSPLDIERSIWSGLSYEGFEAIKGNFDLTAIRRTTDRNFDPQTLPQLSTYNGIDVYSWNSDENLDKKLALPIFDDVGQGRTLAVQQYDIFGSTQANYVYQMIDASTEKINSLADNPRYLIMAENLENMGTMSAVMNPSVMNPESMTWTGWDTAQIADFFMKAGQAAPLMGPYTVFASGLGKDKQGLFVTLVLVYETPEMAESDVFTLKNRVEYGVNNKDIPWKDEIESSEVWAEGNALCARLRGNVFNYWPRLVRDEPLLAREN